ncbi:MAG: hypothetical protein ABEI57_01805, partial [Halapricum sp.]
GWFCSRDCADQWDRDDRYTPERVGEPRVATDGGTFKCEDCGDEFPAEDAKALTQPGGEDAIIICPDCQVKHPYDRQYAPTDPEALRSDGDAQ